MAKKPDGAAAGTQRVTFTKPAAERIGKVVRQVEAGNRDIGPLEWGPRGAAASGKVFRVCTFTGAWAINTAKTVTFRGVTSAPNTISATNITYDLPSQGEMPCSIAKDGTAWYLVGVKHTMTDVIIGATLGTAGLVFTRARIQVASTASASQISIGTTACT